LLQKPSCFWRERGEDKERVVTGHKQGHTLLHTEREKEGDQSNAQAQRKRKK